MSHSWLGGVSDISANEQVFMQYGHSALRQLGTSAQQRYEDENMHISRFIFVQMELLLIENMG
jgi:hypothetical protein